MAHTSAAQWLGEDRVDEVRAPSGITITMDNEVSAGHFAEGGTGGSSELGQAQHFPPQMPPPYYQQQGFSPYLQHGHPGMAPHGQHPGMAPYQAYGPPPYQGGSMPYQGPHAYQGAPSIYQDPWSGGGPAWPRQRPGYRDFAGWVGDRNRGLADREDHSNAPGPPRERTPPWGVQTREWEVVIDKRNQELGIDVLQVGHVLSVSRVKHGPVKAFNQSNRDLRINVGDSIVEVNGATGNCEAIIAAIKNNQKLTFKVSRLLEFGVTITKRGTLGLDVAHAGGSLRILRVGEGPFREWNAAGGNESTVIRYGDLCVEVNKIRGRSQDLLAAIKAVSVGEELSLLFSRDVPARGGSAAGGSGGAKHRGTSHHGGSQDEHDEDSYDEEDETSPDQTPEPSPRVSPEVSVKASPETSPRGGHIALPIPD